MTDTGEKGKSEIASREARGQEIDPMVVRAVEKFQKTVDLPNESDFIALIQRASLHPEFPRAFFDQSEIANQYRAQAETEVVPALELDQSLLQGIYTSLNEKDEPSE